MEEVEKQLLRLPSSIADARRSFPDVVVVFTTISTLLFIEWIHRRRLGPRLPSYKGLPFCDRFDWNRRIINLLFQVVQLLFNIYLLTADKQVSLDYIYGYSLAAHIGFLSIVSFYMYDSIGIVMHPSPSSRSLPWLIHHLVAIVLLLWIVSYKQSFAFPAAAFLVSAAGHIPNELRWFIAAANVRNQIVINTVLLLCFIFTFLFCGVPPLYLLQKIATQLHTTMYSVFFSRMRSHCVFVFLLVYIPHVVLLFHQLHRLVIYWNRPSEPFRTRKID